MIVGEPGIGKSRLLHELRRQLGRNATWVQGNAQSFGRSMPFHPVIDMTRRVCRVDDSDPESVIIEKVERARQRVGVEDTETVAVIRYLLSVDPGDPVLTAMDPERRHAAIIRATHGLMERGSELRPHVVVIEDVHWSDPATEDWIIRLAGRIATKRVLLVLTYRPGYRPGFGSQSFHTALALSTLTGEESLSVAGGLLGAADLPASLQTLVLDKADGNPFFIEELVRSLEEVGAVRRDGDGSVSLAASLDHVAVPDTVQEVILARTHRLDERLRSLLEVASVIGKNVPFSVLRAVTGRSEEALSADLRRLQESEFSTRRAASRDRVHLQARAHPRRGLRARRSRAAPRAARTHRGGAGGPLSRSPRGARRAAGLSRAAGRALAPRAALLARAAPRPSRARPTARRSRPSSRPSPRSRTCPRTRRRWPRRSTCAC